MCEDSRGGATLGQKYPRVWVPLFLSTWPHQRHFVTCIPLIRLGSGRVGNNNALTI